MSFERIYSKTELKKQLRWMYQKYGEPSAQLVHQLSQKGKTASLMTFVRVFGSWTKAKLSVRKQVAQEHIGGYSRYYSDEELLAQLRRVAKALGFTPSINLLREACRLGLCASHSTYIRRFGSYSNALERAGLQARWHGGMSKLDKARRERAIQVLTRLAKVRQ